MECGLQVETLVAAPAFPDATFVEDTAVIVRGHAILTRPGATSRLGEVDAIRDAVATAIETIHDIIAPGTLDGGDVCEHGAHMFIGISHRTNTQGAQQLAEFVAPLGVTCTTIDIREMSSILHLKSGLVSIDESLLVAIDELADHPSLKGHTVLRVSERDAYAANCVRVNDHVLVPDGFPVVTSALRRLGFDPLLLAMSEFQKMDGGLSCLSLRF